jgi:hypothetical protein
VEPLSEWTRDELLVCVYESHPNAQSALGELLRRERERCKGVCTDAVRQMAVLVGGAMDSDRLRGAIQCAETIAERIGEMQ